MTHPQRAKGPRHQCPQFIQQMVECTDTKPQRDVLLAVITVQGATLGRLLRVNYSS